MDYGGQTTTEKTKKKGDGAARSQQTLYPVISSCEAAITIPENRRAVAVEAVQDLAKEEPSKTK
jgi:hypothetical protein